jgi:hypothetical protein
LKRLIVYVAYQWEQNLQNILLNFSQTYADYTAKKRASVLKRVKKKYKIKKSDKEEKDESDISGSTNFEEPKLGIALEDYIQIFGVLIHIDDVDKVRLFDAFLATACVVTSVFCNCWCFSSKQEASIL